MKEEEIKSNFANNIKYLRNSKHFSQEKLGKVLGYSDKSISKWECGDVLPDIVTLNLIAEYFSITVNDLIKKEVHIPYNKNLKRIMLIIIPLFGILAIASLLFFVFSSFTQMDRPWLVYVLSFPCYFIVMIVISALYFNYKTVMLSVSLLSWSIVSSIFIIFLSQNFWSLFIVAIILQIFYILLGVILKTLRKGTKTETT